MNILQAILLGIVQGLTEFIPISSTAHLIFASRWLNVYQGDAEKTTATIAVIQLGTLAAVLVYFARDIITITNAFLRDHLNILRRGRRDIFGGTRGVRPAWLSHEAWIGWLIIFGSIPIGTLGLVLKKFIEGPATKNLWLIGTVMIVMSLLLAFAEWIGKRRTELRNFGISDALAVGFAQVLALIPGASRSGSTITGGLLAGQTRESAARFSFLLSIPAISASGLLELKEARNLLAPEDFMPLIVGTIVSAVVGYASIWFLMNYLKKHSTGIFIIYRLIVGSLILGGLYFSFIRP